MIECTRCGIKKLETEFYAASTKKNGLSSWCKACTNENSRSWKANNPERSRESQAAWREQNRESARERSRDWRAANPDRSRDGVKRWQQGNPDRVRAIHHRKRSIKLSLDHGCVTAETLKQRLDELGRKCVYCGGAYEHLDHFNPLARGGLHCIENLVPACQDCNQRKHANEPEVFMERVRS